jgi:RNA-metabolizing metallo-beta-lactamase
MWRVVSAGGGHARAVARAWGHSGENAGRMVDVAARGRMFIVHGEPAAQDVLQAKIKETLGWDSSCPDYGAHVEI